MADLKTWLVLIGLGTLSIACHSKTNEDGSIKTPLFTRLEAPGVTFESEENGSRHIPRLSQKMIYPFNLTAHGPLGGKTIRTIRAAEDLANLKIEAGIIKDKDSNPIFLADLPKLCPRLSPKRWILSWNKPHPSQWVYDGRMDPLNNTPGFQFMDSDRMSAISTFTKMDGKNVLALKEVTLTYDYEDNHIVDYTGPDPITKRPVVINEGDGGFYANLHYAVFPHKEDLTRMDPQTLLNIAQGKAADIGRPELAPSLRTHSLIPGPFLSGNNFMYDLCEWGDTAFQAPSQHLAYDDIAMWDWDFDQSEYLWIVVWEGDEEDWLIQKKRLDPLYLTDDLVGIFKIKREDTLVPLTLVNKQKNFKMTVETTKIKMSR